MTFSAQQLQKDDHSSTRQEILGKSNISLCVSCVARSHEQLPGLSGICRIVRVDSQFLLLCSRNTKVNMMASLPMGTQIPVGND